MDQERFTEALGWVFEASPWVATNTWPQSPFDSLDALHGAMVRTVELAGEQERLGLLRAHPDLGTRASISEASRTEQDSAGFNRAPHQLERLNAMYREKFGFPFIFAVKDGTKHAILLDLDRRLHSTREAEIQCALQHVYRIARFRLIDALQEEV